MYKLDKLALTKTLLICTNEGCCKHCYTKAEDAFLTEPASCSNSLLRPFSSFVSSSGGLGMGG